MPQTKGQCLRKIMEMADTIRANIRNNAEQLLNSGAVDLSSYDDTYILPIIILVACLEKEVGAWRLPPSMKKRYSAEIENLRHF